MARRREAEKREILPDPKYSDILVARFINNLLKKGKKSLAEKLFYSALDNVAEKLKEEKPLAVFKKAVEMKSHLSKYHFELGNAYRSLKRHDESLAEYRLTLVAQPDHIQAQNNIGVLFWSLKQYDLAEEAFQKALALGADHSEIHNNLASIYMIQKRHGQAIPHLERLIALQPDNAKAKELLEIAMTLKGINP